MIEYVKFQEKKDQFTTFTFNQLNEKVKVNRIEKGYVTLVGTRSDIVELIGMQDSVIEVHVVPKEQFLQEVKNCHLLKVIDDATSVRIREKYSLSDELSMNYKADDNPEKIAFLEYRAEQIQKGRSQKEELGLI